MLFYSFESLDNFINNELMTSIELENKRLDEIENLYKNQKNNFLTTASNIISTISDTISEKQAKDFYNTANMFKTSFEQLDAIYNLTEILRSSLLNITSLHDKNIENNYNEIKAELIEYDKKSDELSNKIFEFENTSTSALMDAFKYIPNLNKKIKTSKKVPSKNPTNLNPLLQSIETSSQDNNTLLVSEKDQKAYLPYWYSDVQKIFKNSKNKYKTLQDVVDDVYTLPLSIFKSSSMARFREAFNLIRNKEHGSITKALDLGLELIFKYELNPIIIAGCRNLDELDIYLDCLDKNELNEFNCFNIKFEISPKNIKN